jgi:hypothetical protein
MKTYWHLMQYNATLHTTNDSIHVFADAFAVWLSQGLCPPPPHTHTLIKPLCLLFILHRKYSVHVSTFTIGIATNYSTGKFCYSKATIYHVYRNSFFQDARPAKKWGSTPL